MGINFGTLPSASNRQLSIDFEIYTDGDPDFKKELIASIIDNLKELQASVVEAMEKNKLEVFEKVCHKIKPTLTMLEDSELLDLISDVKVRLSNKEDGKSCIEKLTALSDQIINSLEDEMHR